jgi:arylsulfatase A-like enzyme
MENTSATTEPRERDQHPPSPVRSALLLAVWFGVICGVVEGLGLLVFQWINWASWGKFLHVSAEILWISATFDLVFFSLMTVALAWVLSRVRRTQVLAVVFIILATLTFYDWFELTYRLSRLSCLILGAGLAVALNRVFSKQQGGILEFLHRNVRWLGVGLTALVVGIQGGRALSERLFVSGLPAPTKGAPNVLVIVVDTLRADHLSTYGYGLPTSPNFDRFAKSGAVFENAFSTSSWTLPSHASLLTGTYPHEHQANDAKGHRPYDHRYPTIAEIFSQHGYRTGAFSANTVYFTRDMGLGYGFAHFDDYFSSPADILVRTFYGKEVARQVLGRKRGRALVARLGFSYFQDIGADDDYQLSQENLGLAIKRRASNVNHALLAWLERDRSRPWFAFLNYMDVHPPYRAPSRGREITAKNKWELLSKLYDYDIQDLDRSFNDLLQALGERHALGNTIIIFTSDHGEMFGEHGLYRHQNGLYKGVIHVPLVIWKPGTVPATRVPRAVTNADIAATLIDLVGWSGESHFPGTSLREVWTDPDGVHNGRAVLSEMAQFKFRPARFPCRSGPLKSLIDGNLHYIFHKKFGPALYDWTNDPQENKNLLENDSRRDLASKFEFLLHAAIAGGTAGTIDLMRELEPPTVIQANAKVTASVSGGARHQLYELSIGPGSVLKLQLVSEKGRNGAQADPIMTVFGQDGHPLNTCRNPEDDNPTSNVARDPTPDAYDDLCVNDDVVPGVNTNAELLLKLPGQSSVRQKIYVQVADWDGRPLSEVPLQLIMTEKESEKSQQNPPLGQGGGE